MTADPPRIALAVPIYNGARYLADALAALQAQTERRWVAVVTDNASTDATAEIVRRAAMADSRIRYHRNATNLGANGNFNRSMALAVTTGAPAVKWVAHDDRPRPDYLARCLNALDAHPDAVGAHSAISLIDDDGAPFPHDPEAGGFLDGTGVWRWTPDTQRAFADPDPGHRLSRFLHDKAGQWLIYGVWRADAVARTRPFAMPGVEDALCAELLLRGPVAFVDEVLFEQRHHAGSARHLSRRDYIEYETGVRPNGWALPSAGRAVEFAHAIRRAPLDTAGRRAAWGALARFALGTDRLRNVVVPGPNNYFGLGAG
ncbi:glycosyltransferase family 2 protein [Rubrivirga sp.]|uniref:glycosyltransferase family 2 protein n=1 Tax=Rubrivirga sp. TaxID=1885344 RepID=UPI003B523846